MNKIIAILFLLSFIFVNCVFAQPRLTLHFTGGYSLPLPDLKGEIPPEFSINDYQMKNGFNFGADGKYALIKKGTLRITGSLAYTMFINSGDLEIAVGTAERKINILTAGLGVEYAFLPKQKISPFIGAEFTGNFFNGKYIENAGGFDHEYNLKAESRFGVQIGAGVDFALNKNIGIVVGSKYSLANLIGKDYDTSTVVTEYTLNDKEYTSATGVTVTAKNISYLQFYAGISFYLMQPKKVVKK